MLDLFILGINQMNRHHLVQLWEEEMINRHQKVVAMLEEEWGKVQELPVGNEYGHGQEMIRNNVLCILNVQANWIQLKLPGRYRNNERGLVLESGKIEMKLRSEQDYLENMWPVLPKHYRTDWDRFPLKQLTPQNMTVCLKCEDEEQHIGEYIGDVCMLLKEVKIMISEGKDMPSSAASRDLMQMYYLNATQN
jgi:hypothetical protein